LRRSIGVRRARPHQRRSMSLPQYLPFDAPPGAYEAQAAQLLAGHAAGEPSALRIFHSCLPRFLDPEVPWKPLPITEDEIRAARLSHADAQLALARAYSFRDWAALIAYSTAATFLDSATHRFEAAVEAVIGGDAATLRAMLDRTPELVHARSTRITCHDPALHGATLLHYLGAIDRFHPPTRSASRGSCSMPTRTWTRSPASTAGSAPRSAC
jgi:hypothetical protein